MSSQIPNQIRTLKLPFLMGMLFAMALLPAGWDQAASDGNSGTIPLLVKSRVPLTPDVVAAIGSHAAHVSYVWPEIGAMALTVSSSRISDLTSDPLVVLVEADQRAQVPGQSPDSVTGSAPPSVVVPFPYTPGTIQTWNQDMADTGGTGLDGAGVTVAVLDSGLPQNWAEFLPSGTRVDTEHAAGFGADGNGDFHNPVNAVRGVGGHIGLFPHGLAVSSVIVGFPSEFGPIGGAAPAATILPIRVIDQFNIGWFSWLTAGILYVGHLKAEGAIPGPVVINFSIEPQAGSTILADAIDYAIGHGVLFVTIAGNFGPFPGSISFPGRLPESITVGAAGWTSEGCGPPVCASPWFFAHVPENDPVQVYVASFSGRETDPPPSPTAIDVLAPGAFVFGEWLFGPGYSEGREVAFDAEEDFLVGTSFSAPHVAGIVAQMLQKNPHLTQSEAESILRASALPIAPSPGVVATPIQLVFPWGANATGSGLARGTSAVAATLAP